MRRLTSRAAVVAMLALAGSWPVAVAAEEHGKPEKGGEAPKGEKEKEKGEKGEKG